MIALTSFYRALAIGTMSIVAPLSATGAGVPVLVGLASGERPAAIQLIGIVLAMVGVMLAGREAGEPDAEARRTARASVALALLAALGFGTFFVGIDQAEQSADVAWVLLSARGPETLLLIVAFALSRARVPRDSATLRRARGGRLLRPARELLVRARHRARAAERRRACSARSIPR